MNHAMLDHSKPNYSRPNYRHFERSEKSLFGFYFFLEAVA
jgi:hypothetical protein